MPRASTSPTLSLFLVAATVTVVLVALFGTGCGSVGIVGVDNLGGSAEHEFTHVFTENADFDTGISAGVNHDRAGELRLNVDLFAFNTPYLWAPLFVTNQLVRVDTMKGEKLGESIDLIFNGETCYNPSRTTVDIGYGVWVGCRGNWGDPTDGDPLTKYEPDRKVIHVNKDGVVDQVLYAGWAARAVALDAYGHLWVGSSYDGTVWEFDPATGECLVGDSTPDQPCNTERALCLRQDGACGFAPGAPPLVRRDGGTFPYGAMVDQDGFLWLKGSAKPGTDYVAALYKVDIRHEPGHENEHSAHGVAGVFTVPADKCSCTNLYGMTIDLTGDVWTGGAACNDVKHFRSDGTFVGCYPAGGMSGDGKVSKSMGVAVDVDGSIWVANNNQFDDPATASHALADLTGSVTHLDPSGKILQTVLLESAERRVLRTKGVGVDAFGNIWAMGATSNDIMQFNPAHPTELRVIDAGGGMYTYSDMLGTGLRTVTTRQKVGTWTAIVDSRAAQPTWGSVAWTATAPERTSVSVSVRCANEREALKNAAWSQIANNPDAVPCSGERYLQVRATLAADGVNASPALQDLTLSWSGTLTW
ncbi:MAG: hypothetical protein HY903_17340 [Deltaproteobacteria bacterium]|nr:hypothetical protein [Deltaproteobacteria bacterium]